MSAIEVEKIADSLPALEGTGFAREDVFVEDSAGGKYGDYAVGRAYSARYTYTLPDGRRIAVDDDYYVEDLLALGTEETQRYGFVNRWEMRSERHRGDDWVEAATLGSGFDISALSYESLEVAESEARRMALADGRAWFWAPVRIEVTP